MEQKSNPTLKEKVLRVINITDDGYIPYLRRSKEDFIQNATEAEAKLILIEFYRWYVSSRRDFALRVGNDNFKVNYKNFQDFLTRFPAFKENPNN